MQPKTLEIAGLSKNEAKVYLAMLGMGQQTATPIVRASGIPNSKAYPTLEKLMKKGLVSVVVKDNARHYQACEPSNLLELLGRKEKEIAEQKEELEKIVKELAAQKNSPEAPTARVYEGYAGIKTAFEELLDSLPADGEYCVFTLGDELKEQRAIDFFRTFHKRRIKKGIKARLIANSRDKGFILKNHKFEGMSFRFAGISLPSGIFIFKSSIMTLVWDQEPIAFVLSSKLNHDSYLAFFEEIWKKAER